MMKTLIKVLLLATCYLTLFLNIASAQNVLDGVYAGSTKDTVINGDTLKSFITGMVTDETGAPLPDALIELFTSSGESLGVKSDRNGRFIFTHAHLENVKIKSVCSKEGYISEVWDTTTVKIPLPIQLHHNFHFKESAVRTH
jgi:hypothetical protein